jgi:hypothetical protein
MAAEATLAAPLPSASECRDIFYSNAARFFQFADDTGQ